MHSSGAHRAHVAAKRVDGNLSSTVRVFVLEHIRAAGQKETKA
jgi:predicted DNA-binding ribbon-helix-helix protein